MFKSIGIIGAGVMGEVFIKQLVDSLGCNPAQITACCPDPKRLKELEKKYKIKTSSINSDGVVGKDLVIMAVKPQQATDVLKEIKPFIKNQTVISIMAGVSISTITKLSGTKKIVRCMPNTPAQIGYGMSVWKAGDISSEQKGNIRNILTTLGEEMEVKTENKIDVATAVSGSGPAYVFDFASHLIEAAVELGFNQSEAKKLVSQTIIGAGMLLKNSSDDASVLRKKVTSKGGTTEAAFKVIDQFKLAKIYKKALKMAYKRAVYLKGLV